MERDAGWTLRELVAEVAAELARNYQPADNGQIRAVPDERAIRYYGTLGVVDGPSELRGRTALYGVRHLAQIVAIKRLQSAGKSLEEIQAIMPTLDDATLARVSGIAVSKTLRSRARRAAFWKTNAVQRDTLASAERESTQIEPRQTFAEPRAIATCNVTLAPGVTLSFPANRQPTRDELLALGAAAAPLIAWLLNHAPALQRQADQDPE